MQEIFLARTALQQTCATRSKLDRELSKTLSNATLRSMREVCIHDERGKKEWGWKGGGGTPTENRPENFFFSPLPPSASSSLLGVKYD